jgi:hypothetical protein
MVASSPLSVAVALRDRGALRVHGLLAGQILRREQHVAVQVRLGVRQLRIVLRALRERRIECRLDTAAGQSAPVPVPS